MSPLYLRETCIDTVRFICFQIPRENHREIRRATQFTVGSKISNISKASQPTCLSNKC